MPDKEVFRQERRPINPATNPAQEVSLESVQEMQRAMGQEIPMEPVQIKGNVPPELQKMMKNPANKMQQQKRIRQEREPMHDPRNPYEKFKDENYESVIKKLKPFSAKYDEIVLPSLGKFYDDGNGPANGTVHIRPMTGAEEQILATPRYVKKGTAINKIFEQCLGEQLDPDQLLTIDRTYLLIYLRGISYTPEYDVQVGCPTCTANFQSQINLNSLDIEECPDDFGPKSLEGVMPTSGLKFKYRLSTGKDEQMVNDHRERRVKEYGDNAADDTLTFRAALLIEEIEGVVGQGKIQTIISRLPINDVAYLRNLINEPPFGVKTRIDIICPACTSEFEIDMPLEANFFFPRRKKEDKMTKKASSETETTLEESLV